MPLSPGALVLAAAGCKRHRAAPAEREAGSRPQLRTGRRLHRLRRVQPAPPARGLTGPEANPWLLVARHASSPPAPCRSRTLSETEPIGQRIPIDHFVIVMQENRSFDHYFQGLPKFGVTSADVAPAGYHNFDPRTGHDVKMLSPDRAVREGRAATIGTQPTFNTTTARWTASSKTSDPARGERALGYYEASELPYYYQLASTFAIGDRYFGLDLGPTSGPIA